MFVCSIPVVIVFAILATALPSLFGQKVSPWYLLALPFAPGWLLAWLITPERGPGTWHTFDVALNAFYTNFVYWFVWIFWFVLRSDPAMAEEARRADRWLNRSNWEGTSLPHAPSICKRFMEKELREGEFASA